jgi:VIT1/CCC1 family predicted Fe2+/Mn2+ transporter
VDRRERQHAEHDHHHTDDDDHHCPTPLIDDCASLFVSPRNRADLHNLPVGAVEGGSDPASWWLMPARTHGEIHRTGRIGWLRAGVLGAQDGVVSTASLLLGVAAASSDRTALIIAGVAAVVAGALSMAAGEYNSVSSQRDTERADIARETQELEEYPDVELEELTQIYEQRGLARPLARQVAIQLTKADALASHVRDELGIVDASTARPLQAAGVSAVGFLAGSIPSLLSAVVVPSDVRLPTIGVVALVLLAIVGVGGARLGGARPGRPALRLLVVGGIAMAVAALIGDAVGAIT